MRIVCEYCGGTKYRSRSLVVRSQNHFCGNACQNAWRKEQHISTQPRTEYTTVPCGYCDKPLQLTVYRASLRKKHYCNPSCYWKATTDWYSYYRNRDIEGSPRQKLVRFLIMHGAGTSGMPGEDVIIQCKAGYYVPELSPLEQPLETLAAELFKLGHFLLSQCIVDGTWEHEDAWPCFCENWYRRKPVQFPWEV